MPRVLLDGFRTPHLIEVAHKLADAGVVIAYWNSAKTERFWKLVRRNPNHFTDTVFHHGRDCIQAIPALGIDSSGFEPPSKALLEEMLPCEAQALSMMGSTDYSQMSLYKKKSTYYAYVRYWYGVLTHYKIDAVFFHDIPHVAYEYIIFCIAKKLGIKTIMYCLSKLPDRLLFFDDFPLYNEVARAYEKACEEKAGLAALSPDLRQYYKEQTEGGQYYQKVERGYSASTAGSMRLFPSLNAIARNIRRGTFFKTAYWYCAMLPKKKALATIDGLVYSRAVLRWKFYQWGRIKKQYQREYEKVARMPDFLTPFVYVPLHMQPERSTSVQGDIFTDQILMLDMLSAALPKGWTLYVKEHPAQWTARRAHLGRYSGYYKKIASIRNVVCVPAHTPSSELVQKARAVATVTGTAVWEAVLKGVPALIFGYEWYMHCDGMFRVASAEEARKALAKIENGYVPDKEKVVQFLVAIDRISVRGHDRHKVNKASHIGDEEMVNNLFQAFYERVKRRSA